MIRRIFFCVLIQHFCGAFFFPLPEQIIFGQPLAPFLLHGPVQRHIRFYAVGVHLNVTAKVNHGTRNFVRRRS